VQGGTKTHAPASQPQREWSWDELAVAPRLSSNPPRAPTRHPARLGDGHAARCEPSSFAMSVMSTRTGWGSLC
jgi:hypothetical protein